ncbi:MAG: hypothetical protein AB7W37_16640 [Syntrophobacteraceae bacterium]
MADEKKLMVDPDERQVYAFEEVRDARLESADQLFERALLEEASAGEDKKRFTKIYKTKERQLHYAQVRKLIESARVRSLETPGEYVLAADSLDCPAVIPASEYWDHSANGAVFYAAFLDGAEVKVSDARDIEALG